MALDKVFRQLIDALRKLRDSFLALQLTAREDTPREGAVVLVDSFGDAVDDCMGWLEEALTLAAEAEQAVSGSDFATVRRALSCCQERFHVVERRYFADMVSYECVKDLTAFARRRNPEWRAWVKSIRLGAGQCEAPFEEVSRALMCCWQEMADRAGTTSVTVRATNVGQRITTSAGKELVAKEIA
jgi:hypothetical protein